MSAITLTRLYEILIPKLGKEATESLLSYNENKIKSELENSCKHLATKEDVAKLKGDLEAKIEAKFAESIKWMFIFWVGQVIATTASILLFLRK